MTIDAAGAERQAMMRALELAHGGWGRVEPNPLVGCVLLRDGEIVGEGYHAAFGGPHAEVVALAQAGALAVGATAVVTLEPCAHHGKTPPCVDALVEAGVRRVVVASRDPNPDAAGGLDALAARGIDVASGLEAPAAHALNAAFFRLASQSDLPWVAVKLATSLDGMIADRSGRSQWISGAEARAWVQWLRAGFDGIVVGSRTAAIDDPQLTVRQPEMARTPPRRIVVDRMAGLSRASRVVTTAGACPTWVLASPDAPSDRVSDLEAAGVRVLRATSLADGLRQLRSEGVARVLCEGGGALVGALLSADLVDRLYWVQAPVWLGSGGVPAFGALPSRLLPDAPRWSVVERRGLGEDTLLVVDRESCSPDS